MADLTTLDATQPSDSESAGAGASRMREERAAILGSFNLEHALAGAHAFLRGDQAARPAAGNAGRLYLNTTDKRIERDDGAAWNIANAVQTYSSYVDHDTTTVTLTATYQTIMSVSVDFPAGGFLLALGQFEIISGTGFDVNFKVQRDTTDLVPGERTIISQVGNIPLIFAIDTGASVGAHTIKLMAQNDSGSTVIYNRLFVVFIA